MHLAYDNRGFTLIETLVAFMLLVISLTVIMQLFSGGLKSGRVSDDYQRAVLLAKEKMETVLLQKRLVETDMEEETDNGFKINISIRHFNIKKNDSETHGDSLIEQFLIIVDVGWSTGGSGKHYGISTVQNCQKGGADS
ncbi:GspI [Desulforapulum autotrophicum HRM2]|uniref:GspI n=1 Tax=Desulforapulum autotrophicum (strain ATCC 43914 / DSM 3382 / VKM B-1955 / HRM2) TaxID=177437 RepID=C0QK74_DESAH|nr:type II secretion system protein [Desulforapulum autotrophicum]ACN16100.1 GspI [Desulforapulum autotrophicum HRM2]